MADISEDDLLELLFAAIEKVRHRGIMKRRTTSQPLIPKTTSLTGKDWKPCEVCRDETRMIIEELKKGKMRTS